MMMVLVPHSEALSKADHSQCMDKRTCSTCAGTNRASQSTSLARHRTGAKKSLSVQPKTTVFRATRVLLQLRRTYEYFHRAEVPVASPHKRRLRLVRAVTHGKTNVRTERDKERPQQAKVMVSAFVRSKSSVARSTFSFSSVTPCSIMLRPCFLHWQNLLERKLLGLWKREWRRAPFRHSVTLSPIRGCGPSEQPAFVFLSF
ncbi:hypothetical protein SK128_016334 [Halocaridina rubra]|uniref:Uncharacterized protein n=1 Tax=Halocaridina rubra TaxID=373956 RepID=A0AAN8WT11_HALRR